MVRTISLIAVLALPCAAMGGHHHCGNFFHHKAVAVVAQPVVLYQAGRDIEAEALAEKVARLVAQKLQAPLTQRAEPLTQGLLSQRCASCHNGTRAFDISGGMSPEQYLSFSKMAGLGEYPPG